MSEIDYNEFSNNVCEGLRKAFTKVMTANADQTFYAFAIWTDDSLQFANPCANTEEGLLSTVERYQKEVDPRHNTTSTVEGMRWAYGDWEYFPLDDQEDLEDVNEVLSENFNSDEETFEQRVELLWEALLNGFKKLEQEGFFGVGEAREQFTLLVVGHVPDERVDHWAVELNPKKIAEKFIHWGDSMP